MADLPKGVPEHVAIIMDGNGRWAQNQGKIRTSGHKAGVNAVRSAVSFARKNGIQSLTLFAFSSENWKRPEQEVSVLMELFMMVLNSEVKKLHKNGVKLNVIGDTSQFSESLQKHIAKAEKLTNDNSDLTLNIAANYGGHWDICMAAQTLAVKVQDGELQPEQISPKMLSQHIQLSEQPEVDLLIRTGGDHRISNFLLWQLAYAELYFSEVLWPDFDEDCFQQAVDSFIQRERRFGMTGEQIKEQ